MKGLDELSWKMSKKFFFDVRRPCWGLKWPLKCIKTAFTARKNSSPIFKIHEYMLYQNDHNNISPAKTERFFKILLLVIFYAPGFLAVSIFHVIWYWEVPFDPQTIKKVKKSSLSWRAKSCCDHFGISYVYVSSKLAKSFCGSCGKIGWK